MYRSRILEHSHELMRLRPLWDELADRDELTMFQSYAWNLAAVETFGERERTAVVYAESDAGGAIIPAVVTAERVVRLLGETLFDYRTMLWMGEVAIARRARGHLAELGAHLSITAVRKYDAPLWEMWVPRPFAGAPSISAARLTEGEFRAAHSQLGYSSRKLRRHGIELRLHTGAESTLVRWIYQRKGMQGDAKANLFSDASRREFMVRVAAESRAACEIFTYETAGELVAAIVSFRDRNTRRCYTIYYDERWAALSPGQVLLFEVAADALGHGLDVDMMTGEHPYKMRLATSVVPLFRVEAPTAGAMVGEVEGRLAA